MTPDEEALHRRRHRRRRLHQRAGRGRQGPSRRVTALPRPDDGGSGRSVRRRLRCQGGVDRGQGRALARAQHRSPPADGPRWPWPAADPRLAVHLPRRSGCTGGTPRGARARHRLQVARPDGPRRGGADAGRRCPGNWPAGCASPSDEGGDSHAFRCSLAAVRVRRGVRLETGCTVSGFESAGPRLCAVCWQVSGASMPMGS